MNGSDGPDDLERILAELDRRARAEPRLEQYRVAGGGTRALDAVPDGWVLSAGIARIAEHGGWWPGRWEFPELGDTLADVLASPAGPVAGGPG